ncbi:trehalose-phosphatase [Micromonospora costi]|uniref:Trehalose 6-phosphate phosphatase n=1 Tax=Micromonospora costi TaxID=1530042 RepID=A0A3B0AJY3_9ACTN|nr:trehalose-phosphatase [Micromonospora costi]RKN59176.1 trehalose-phosphatase [Micromonospora costi]
MPPLNLGSDQQPRTPMDADEAWRTTAGRAAGTVLFFDFDGTLAPVGDDPTAVQPAPNVLAAIEALAPRVRRIAIVSARPVEFLRDRLGGLAGVDLYGLYGLEHSYSGGDTVTEPAALPWVPTMAELADLARAELPAGTLVEFKRLSVALHWRTAPRLGEAVQEWGQAQADRLGLRVQGGRMVLELKPPVDRDKGMVIGELIRDAEAAWYFGDDVSDIRAFAAVRARAATDPDFFGVCVAVANPETGQEVADAADLTIDSPAALGDFLSQASHRLA